MAIEIKGGATTNEVEVNASNQLQVITGQAESPATVGGIRVFSENDAGDITGEATLKSPETDGDYRIRVSHDVQLDNEVFDYTAQNTGKYLYRNTTMVNAWSASGLTTNSGNITTTTTAALGSGLGGQFWETDTLAVTTDGVICSYQVPAGTANVQGRRLVLRGVNINSFIQTALTGGGYVAQWSIAFGHTTVSLATAEAATSKASRRVGIGVQAVVSGAVISTVLNSLQINFDSPIYVNPSEFIAIVKKKVGTAPSAGVIAHLITLDYGWE